MKRYLALFLVLLGVPSGAWGAAFTSKTSGSLQWNDGTAWNNSGTGLTCPNANIPCSGDTFTLATGTEVVHIPSGFVAAPGLNTVTTCSLDGQINSGATLVVDAGGDLEPTGGITLQLGAKLAVYGGLGHGYELNYSNGSTCVGIANSSTGAGNPLVEICDNSSCNGVAGTPTTNPSNFINLQSGVTATIVQSTANKYIPFNINGAVLSGWGSSGTSVTSSTSYSAPTTTSGHSLINAEFINNGQWIWTRGSGTSNFFRMDGVSWTQCKNATWCGTVTGSAVTQPIVDNYIQRTTVADTADNRAGTQAFQILAEWVNVGTATIPGMVLVSEGLNISGGAALNSTVQNTFCIKPRTGLSASSPCVTTKGLGNDILHDQVWWNYGDDPLYNVENGTDVGTANEIYNVVVDSGGVHAVDDGDIFLPQPNSTMNEHNNILINGGGTGDLIAVGASNLLSNNTTINNPALAFVCHGGTCASTTGINLTNNLMLNTILSVANSYSHNPTGAYMQEYKLPRQTSTPSSAVDYNAYFAMFGDPTDPNAPTNTTAVAYQTGGHSTYIGIPNGGSAVQGTSASCSAVAFSAGPPITLTKASCFASATGNMIVVKQSDNTWGEIDPTGLTTGFAQLIIGVGNFSAGASPTITIYNGGGTGTVTAGVVAATGCCTNVIPYDIALNTPTAGQPTWGVVSPTGLTANGFTLLAGVGNWGAGSPVNFAVSPQLFNNGGSGALYGTDFGAHDSHINPNVFDPTWNVCDYFNVASARSPTANCNNGKNSWVVLGNDYFTITAVNATGATPDVTLGTSTNAGSAFNASTMGIGVGDYAHFSTTVSSEVSACEAIVTGVTSNTRLVFGALSPTTGVAGAGTCGTVTTSYTVTFNTAPQITGALAFQRNGWDMYGNIVTPVAWATTANLVPNILAAAQQAARPYNGQLKNAGKPSVCDRTKSYNTCDIGAVDVFPAAINNY